MNTFESSWSDSLIGKGTEAVPQQARKPAQKPRSKYPAPPPACQESRFLVDVSKHQMTVLRDDGLNRHLHFAEPGNCNRWFDLVTWDGVLVITGDSGTYVFSRVPDMFGFFRDRSEPIGQSLKINPQYWAQKCIAQDKDGIERWNGDYFKHRVWEWMQEGSAKAADKREIEREVISLADDGEFRAMAAAMDYRCESGYQLYDFCEADCTVYTHYFLWCCYGIAWGIKQYDAHLTQPASTIVETIQA